MAEESTRQGPEATRFQKGKSGNPGGMTAEERAARDLLRQSLSDPEMVMAWRVAYRNQLVAENPLILKDFADRVGGKVKERVQLEDEDGNVVSPLRGATLEQVLEIVRSGK